MNAYWLDIILAGSLCASLLAVYGLQKPSLDLVDGMDFNSLEKPKRSLIGILYPSKLIRQSGLMPMKIIFLYWSIKLSIAMLVFLLMINLQALEESLVIPSVSAMIGFILFDLWLIKRRSIRKQRITMSLSYFIDVLCSCLSSGATLPQAFEQAASYAFSKSHPLSLEASLVAREISAGLTLRQAFLNLSRRTGVIAFSKTAALLDVGLLIGAPIHDTLAQHAVSLRDHNRSQLKHMINRKSIEMLFPLGLVGFPMFSVLVIFPAIVQLYESLQILKYLV